MPLTGPHAVTVPGLISGWSALHAKGAALSWARGMNLGCCGRRRISGIGGLADHSPRNGRSSPKTPAFARYSHRTVIRFALQEFFANRHWNAPCAALPKKVRRRSTGKVGAHTRRATKPRRAHHVGRPEVRTRVTEQAPGGEVDGWTVLTAPPNSQGFVLLRLLGMLAAWIPGTSNSLQQRVPAKVLAGAFHETAAERDRILADPEWMTDDVEALLTEDSLDACHHRSWRSRKVPANKVGVPTVTRSRCGRGLSGPKRLSFRASILPSARSCSNQQPGW